MKDEDKTKVELIKELKTTQKEREKGVFKNIAEHKEAEEELKESEKKYQRLFENMMNGLVLYKLITDKNGHPVDYIIEEVNKAAEKLTGYKRKELIGKSFLKLKLLSLTDMPKAAKLLAKNLKGQPTGPDEFILNRKDNSKVIAEISTYPDKIKGRTLVLGMAKDITKRKKAEKTLAESEARYRTVFENTSTTTMIVEEDDMTISMINTQCKKLIGYSKKEIENKMKWTDFIIPEDLERMKKFHIARRKTRWNPPTEYEFRLIDKKGNIKDIFLKIGMIPNTKKSIASLTDITERKQAEEALQEAHHQLETKVAQRTKELQKANLKLQELDHLKSMFIASMSHELRTPLNSIIGFTGIMLHEMPGEINEEQRKQLNLVKNSANHLLALINDVIDISKIIAGKVEITMEEFDLSVLIQEIKDSFAVAIDKKRLELLPQTPQTFLIKSDKRRTKQILVNFISNAIKFTDRGEIEIKVIQKNEIVEVSVRDTGIGIKKEDMGKLFETFSRITTKDRIEEGTGLGLYLSQKIAHLLGGDITAKSKFGKGSVFTLTLPLKR
jgi:PAS domain S-box-containing protein